MPGGSRTGLKKGKKAVPDRHRLFFALLLFSSQEKAPY
jgi:hypothetical protein